LLSVAVDGEREKESNGLFLASGRSPCRKIAEKEKRDEYFWRLAANVFQLYAVVVFIVMLFTTVLKLIKDILFKSIPQATIA